MFTDEERANMIIINNHMYRHRVVRVNYTTYNNRREQDTINPHTRADIMMLSSEDGGDSHPYWYAHILNIFHASVHSQSKSLQPQHMEFFLVRWFGCDTSKLGGWKTQWLHRFCQSHKNYSSSTSHPHIWDDWPVGSIKSRATLGYWWWFWLVILLH